MKDPWFSRKIITVLVLLVWGYLLYANIQQHGYPHTNAEWDTFNTFMLYSTGAVTLIVGVMLATMMKPFWQIFFLAILIAFLIWGVDFFGRREVVNRTPERAGEEAVWPNFPHP